MSDNIIIIEHVTFGVGGFIDCRVPDGGWVRSKIVSDEHYPNVVAQAQEAMTTPFFVVNLYDCDKTWRAPAERRSSLKGSGR